MKITRKMYNVAYNLGYSCGMLRGGEIYHNPYHKDDEYQQYHAWEDGFLDAKEEKDGQTYYTN